MVALAYAHHILRRDDAMGASFMCSWLEFVLAAITDGENGWVLRISADEHDVPYVLMNDTRQFRSSTRGRIPGAFLCGRPRGEVSLVRACPLLRGLPGEQA